MQYTAGIPASQQALGLDSGVKSQSDVEDEDDKATRAQQRHSTDDEGDVEAGKEVGEVDFGRYLNDFERFFSDYVFKSNDIPKDNEKFLAKIRQRFDNAGVDIPTIEVRYENLTIKGKVHVGGRALPTLLNTILDFFDGALSLVNLSRSKKNEIMILDGVTGILKPGRMTLLLAPPSGGKSTLLCTLAGVADPTLEVKGNVTYNGYKLEEFEPLKTAIYVSQMDLHMPELTVRETMDYSARYQGVGSQQDLNEELVQKEKELGLQADPGVDLFMKTRLRHLLTSEDFEFVNTSMLKYLIYLRVLNLIQASATKDTSHELMTEYYMKIMGLDICSDTIAGDQMRKGISGGQKKRLTTGEMIVGPARVLFMDDISTGLDSSTTLQVVDCIRQFAHLSKKTILMSLLQPAPEAYALFDDVILLSENQIVYHGPCQQVEEFFGTFGFRRPPRKGIADYLQEVTSRRDQEQYWSDKGQPYRYVSAKEFSEGHKKSHAGQEMSRELAIPFDRSKSHKAALAFNRWSLSQWELLNVTFRKECLLYKRNFAIQLFLVIQLAFSATIVATLFFRTENHRDNFRNANKYAGALFLTLMIVALSGFAEVTFTAMKFPYFIKFREMLFYPPWTWTLSMAILKIPASTFEALTFVGISYYVIDFAPAATRFLKLLLVLILISQACSALFRMLAGFCKTLVLTTSIAGVVLVAMDILGGFVMPRREIRGWWIWGYWTFPLSYAQNALMVNEYFAHQWKQPLPDGTFLGHGYVHNLDLFPKSYWYWLAIGALVVFTLSYNGLFTLAVTILSRPSRSRSVKQDETPEEIDEHATGETHMHVTHTGEPSSPRSVSSGSNSASRRGRSLDVYRYGSGQKGSMRLSSGSHGLDHGNGSSSGRSDRFAPSKGLILPFEPYSISFKDIGYAVDMPKGQERRSKPGEDPSRLYLIRGITGAFRPGVLTALVGVTGAGKSTLMDVLSGRKTKGYVEGDIRVNGFPKRQKTFSRIAGYCEQDDIHSPQCTVYESLVFSAWLRLQATTTSEMKLDFALEVMDMVELTSLKDALVGVPGQTGLSTEQRKRLTIAVELVANPSIIFMDEPTSGLDARSAATVMRAVRNTVDTGRTVVCTIHQPSIDIFESFDELLLLKRGGEAIYAGPLGRNSHHLITYFQNNADVPKIKDGENPAAWMLDITNPGMEHKLGVDFGEIYRNSSAFQVTKDLVERLGIPPPGAQDLSFDTEFVTSLWEQFLCCLWRSFWSYWRNPGYNLMRIGLSTALGIFTGTMYWGMGKKLDTERHIHAIAGSIFVANGFYGVLTCYAVQPIVGEERVVFYRERAAGLYSEIPYALASCVIEIPYILVASTALQLIQYSMLKFQWNLGKVLWCLYFTFCSQITFSYLGLVTVALTPNAQTGSVLAGFAVHLWSSLSGFGCPLPQIPIWWKWAFWINPMAYPIYGTLVALTGKIDNVFLTNSIGTLSSVRTYVRDEYGFRYGFLKLVGPLAALFPFVFASGYIVCIKYLNYQQR